MALILLVNTLNYQSTVKLLVVLIELLKHKGVEGKIVSQTTKTNRMSRSTLKRNARRLNQSKKKRIKLLLIPQQMPKHRQKNAIQPDRRYNTEISPIQWTPETDHTYQWICVKEKAESIRQSTFYKHALSVCSVP